MTSLRMNSSAARANIRCSSLMSSGMKMSSGAMASMRKLPPFGEDDCLGWLVIGTSCFERGYDDTTRLIGRSTLGAQASLPASFFDILGVRRSRQGCLRSQEVVLRAGLIQDCRVKSEHSEMSIEEFELLPIRAGWKYEYWDGRAHITPREHGVIVAIPVTARRVNTTYVLKK